MGCVTGWGVGGVAWCCGCVHAKAPCPAIGACWVRGLTCETECLLSRKCLVANLPHPQDKSQGPTKSFCFLPHSGRLISKCGVPRRWGSPAHTHTHTYSLPPSQRSSLGAERRPLATQFFLSSKGHFWGSWSVVDSSLPPAWVLTSRPAQCCSVGEFSRRGRVGESGPHGQPAQSGLQTLPLSREHTLLRMMAARTHP